MVEGNWDDIGKAIPTGEYLCEVESVQELTSKTDGKEYLRLKLTVLEGDYAGRSVYDNLFFTDSAIGRVKFVCSRLGIELTGTMDVTPALLTGKIARVSFIVKETVERGEENDVPWGGYELVEISELGAEDVEGLPG